MVKERRPWYRRGGEFTEQAQEVVRDHDTGLCHDRVGLAMGITGPWGWSGRAPHFSHDGTGLTIMDGIVTGPPQLEQVPIVLFMTNSEPNR